MREGGERDSVYISQKSNELPKKKNLNRKEH